MEQTSGLPGGELALQQAGSLQLPAQVTLTFYLLFLSGDTSCLQVGADPGAEDVLGSRAVPPFP